MSVTNPAGHPSTMVYGSALTCHPSTIARCLPSLAVLEQNGVTHLTLMVRIEDGLEVDTSILSPRFFDDIRLLKMSRKEVGSAVRDVMLTVSSAIERAIADDESASSFFAYVTIWQCEGHPGWSTHCEALATVADCTPHVAITLR